MGNLISVVIPNRNGSATIGTCLEAAFSSNYENFEVVVVDDASEDDSVEIIRGFPCKLICLEKPSGASKARNTGAFQSHGDLLFFTDSDCLLKEDALAEADQAFSEEGANVVMGGTYTPVPYDRGFFSTFQSVFVNFSETKKANNPDYIAAHAMVIDAQIFRQHDGFSENFLPILEDVAFSHRLRRAGYGLKMIPGILVQHIFNFSLLDSLRNAVRKSMYWTIYSIGNKDLLADSGTASAELKTNVVSQIINLILFVLWIVTQESSLLVPIPLIVALNAFVNRDLLRAFNRVKGTAFVFLAAIYYILIYAFAVGVGSLAGAMKYYFLGWSKVIQRP